MWYWFRPRFRGGGGCTKEGAWYLTKRIFLPTAILCLIMKLALIFVYHQPVVSAGAFEGFHISPLGWYLLASPFIWWFTFRWWMRRQYRGRHNYHGRWSTPEREEEKPGQFMAFRRDW
jgi:hypothetical protein